MGRFTIGAAVGGAAVYFFDPVQGEDRRRRLQSLWQDNRDTAAQIGDGVSNAAESMRPLVRRVKHRIEQGDWSESAGKAWMPAMTGIVAATAVGGALVYFLDPQNGMARRKRILGFVAAEQGPPKKAFRTVQRAAGTVRPWARHMVDEASKAAGEVRAAGRN